MKCLWNISMLNMLPISGLIWKPRLNPESNGQMFTFHSRDFHIKITIDSPVNLPKMSHTYPTMHQDHTFSFLLFLVWGHFGIFKYLFLFSWHLPRPFTSNISLLLLFILHFESCHYQQMCLGCKAIVSGMCFPSFNLSKPELLLTSVLPLLLYAESFKSMKFSPSEACGCQVSVYS